MRFRPGLGRLEPLLIAGFALAGVPAAADLAYVTNQNSGELSIIDLAAGRMAAQVPLPGKPAGVAVDHGGHVFTVSPGSKQVRLLDRLGAVLAETGLDGGPAGIAADPARGRVFVSDWYNARVWVLDAETLAVKEMLQAGSTPAGLEVSPDGRWLALAERDADRVSIFDAATLELRHRVAVGTRPFGLGFAPDGRLFAGNVGSNDVTVIDPEGGTVLATLPVGAKPYGVGFAAGRAFVSNQEAGTVSVISLATLAPEGEIPVGEYPEGIDATGDGGMIVVANWFSNTVSLIDPVALEVTGEIATGDGPRAFGRFIQAEE